MNTSRFPEFLRAHGFAPVGPMGEESFDDSWENAAWHAERAEAGVLSRLRHKLNRMPTIPAEPGECVIKLRSIRMATEGHYGYEYVDVSEQMERIAERLNSAGQQFPELIVPLKCVLTNGYFVAVRRWLEKPLLEKTSESPTPSDEFSWPDALQQLARQVDDCWLAQPDLPFRLQPSNLFVDSGRLYLADQGTALLHGLIRDIYQGPFIYKVKTAEDLQFYYQARGLPPVHPFACLWTFIRTGLPAPDARMLENGAENGVERLSHREKAIVESTIYTEQPKYRRCADLVDALRCAVDNDAASEA